MKILIAGYYGFGNAGDELILSSMISQLNARYKNADITVLSAAPFDTTRQHQTRAVSRWSPMRVIRELWRNDFLILGGGGLLQNKTSQRSLFFYLSLVAAARLLGCPVVLFAMGVETLDGPWARRATRILLRSRDVTITVRDEASMRILAGIGIPPASITVTADPVFAHVIPPAPRERYTAGASTAVLVPRFPCPQQGRTMFAVIARILREEKKMQVSGLLFQPKTELAYLQSYNGEPILSEDDFLGEVPLEEIAQRVARFDWVVSARFHGLVLAALAGRPFIGVGDPHKVGRLCDTLKMPFLPWGSTEAAIHAAIEKLALKTASASTAQVDRLRAAASHTANHFGDL